ncbi:hypothetical protein [Edaphobacter sp.]|uniref:hypothetical protein n=1 Tax=Edaphobacter sp. TaxID=1934404 RepID=UPI002DBE1A70|nr:hypothetical protein [Edaphobacter sp.]HEU5341950.1 hypothetical protein [Edaphobacter sp.]
MIDGHGLGEICGGRRGRVKAHFISVEVEKIFTLSLFDLCKVQKNSPEYCKVAAPSDGVYLAVELLITMPSDISLKVS